MRRCWNCGALHTNKTDTYGNCSACLRRTRQFEWSDQVCRKDFSWWFAMILHHMEAIPA